MERNVEKAIITFLDEQGFLHSLLGYNYIFQMIKFVLENKENLRKFTNLYAEVANVCDSTGSRVERAIRHSIQKVAKEPITNKEFIYRAVDQLSLAGVQ